MATTFTLTGNIDELSGVGASRVTRVIISSSAPLVDPLTGTTYVVDTAVPVLNGEFTVELPANASPAGYTFTVLAEQIGMSWTVSPAAPGETLNLAELGLDEWDLMEPDAFHWTYTVSKSGRAGTYASVTAALTQANTDHEAWVGTVFQQASQTNPYHWRKIVVEAGIYNESASLSPLGHTAIVGAPGTTRDDVWINFSGVANTLVTTGKSAFVRGVTLYHGSTDPEWHPMRDAGPSGDVGLQAWQRRTIIFRDVRFRSSPAGLAGKQGADLNIGGGVVAVWDRCWFDCPGQPQAFHPGQNTGYVSTKPAAAGLTVIRDAKVTANYDWFPDPTLPFNGYTDGTQTTPAPAAPVGGVDAGAGRGDTLVWVGAGEWDIGSHHLPIQGNIVVVNQGTGDNADYYIDPAVPAAKPPAPAVLVKNAAGGAGDLSRVHRSLPGVTLPRRGVSAAERAFYGPDPTGQAPTISRGQTPVNVNVTAGRIYWVPVDMGPYMMKLNGVRFEVVSSAAGNMAGGSAIDANPVAGAAAGPDMTSTRLSGGVAIATGVQTIPLNVRWFYPGYGRAWLGVAFSVAATVKGATTIAGDQIYTASGYTSGNMPGTAPTLLAAGQPYPLLTGISGVM